MMAATFQLYRLLPLTAVVLWICACSGDKSQGRVNPKSGVSSPCDVMVFSDVKHIDESDDDVGTEIVVSHCLPSETVTGQWDEYEGYTPVSTALRGSVKDRLLRMSAPNATLKPDVEGNLTQTGLTGTLSWYIEDSRQTKSLRLNRVKGRWEDLRAKGSSQ